MNESTPTRTKRRDLVPSGPVETIRRRLELSLGEFSEALGYGRGTYAEMVNEDAVPRVAELAAEALMRRQVASGDVAFLVRLVKGTPQVSVLGDLDEMTLGGRRYLLLPVATVHGEPTLRSHRHAASAPAEATAPPAAPTPTAAALVETNGNGKMARVVEECRVLLADVPRGLTGSELLAALEAAGSDHYGRAAGDPLKVRQSRLNACVSKEVRRGPASTLVCGDDHRYRVRS